MRPLDQVIDATLKLVPQDFPGRTELETELESIKSSFLHAAPEMYQGWWFKFGVALHTAFGEPDTQWKEDVVALIQGKTDYLEVLDKN